MFRLKLNAQKKFWVTDGKSDYRSDETQSALLGKMSRENSKFRGSILTWCEGR